MTARRHTGEERCWPCTIANTAVGLVVGWLPLAAALAREEASLIALSFVWGLLVTAYTSYRLVALGYLPYAEPIAKATGLHDRIGPGSNDAPPDGRSDDE